MQTTAERPEDVTSLAKMAIGSGVFGILVGLALLILPAILDVFSSDSSQGGVFGLGIFATLFIFGVFAFVAGIVSIVFGYGAWKLRPWAWTLGVAFYAVVILLSIAPVILG